MYKVSSYFEAKYEVKKSTFSSYLVPYEEFKPTLERLKQEHPKATHIVWAYRILNEFDQIVENSTDDGEPKGCAGAPSMNVLRGEELINTALITVRYFGGIKLGTGGMVRAYANAVKAVVENAKLERYEKKYLLKFSTPYPLVNRYEHYFKKEKINFKDRTFETTMVKWCIYMTQNELKKFKNFEKNI
jgi:uncharacterized YigZ family protein